MPFTCFGVIKIQINAWDTCPGAKRVGGFHYALNLVIFLKVTGHQWVKYQKQIQCVGQLPRLKTGQYISFCAKFDLCGKAR